MERGAVVTCPFCGAKELRNDKQVIYGDAPRYACGTTFGEILGKCCLEHQLKAAKREIEKLREKKAEGLTWMDFSPTISRALGIAGTGWAIVTRHDGIAVWMDEEPAADGFDTLAAAKAHAEELHQQAWRELRTKWDAK